MKYKAILFDNDGTIVDTERAIIESFKHAMKDVLNDENPNIDEFKSLIGIPLIDQFRHFCKDEEVVDQLTKAYRKHNYETFDQYASNFEGLPEILKTLKDMGYFMGIVTSKQHGNTVTGLEVMGLTEIFEYIQGSDDYEIHKPEAGCLKHACEEIGFDPNEVLYVGDSVYDIHSGNGAGCDTAAVLWGVFSKEKLMTENPTFVLEKPTDLLELLS